MKLLCAIAIVLSSCISAFSYCVTVTDAVPGTKPPTSSRTPQITVLRDGKPQRGVKLTVTLANGHFNTFITDSHGTAILDNLPVGTNCVAATTEDYFGAYMCLAVPNDTTPKSSAFVLSLADTLPPLPSIRSDASPEVHRQLETVVQDASGGILAHAEVRVYLRSSYPNDPLVKAWTDQDGRLTVPLDPGTYAVTARSPGFKAAVRVIEISGEGREDPVREVLQPGEC